jgi:cytochrome b561
MLKNTPHSYGSVAKCFHWTIFALIVALLTVGFLMTDMSNSPDKFKIYGLHKSIGIMVLTLALLRLGWKLINSSPLLPNTLTPLEKLAAKAGHALLYVLILAMPLSGWLMSSAGGFPVSVFGLFTLPDLIAPDKEWSKFFRETHEWLAYAIIIMVSLHALAALLHHYYYKDNVLTRMLPGKGGKDADEGMVGC